MRYHRYVKRQIFRHLQKYKHVQEGVTTATNLNTAPVLQADIIEGADNPVIANTYNVQARAKVKAVFTDMDFWTTDSTAGVHQIFYWCIYFSPQAGISVDPTNVGASTAKTYVIKQGHVTVNQYQPAHVSGLIKIPPKYQRFMNGDYLFLAVKTFNNNGATDNFATKFIYKEIRG